MGSGPGIFGAQGLRFWRCLGEAPKSRAEPLVQAEAVKAFIIIGQLASFTSQSS